MSQGDLLSVLMLILVFFNLRMLSGGGWFFPQVLFIYFNAVMGLGILFQLDYRLEADEVHGYVIVLSAVSYLIGSVVFSSYFSLPRRWSVCRQQCVIASSKHDAQLAVLFYVLSAAMTVLYFYIVGYNVFLYAMSSGVAGDEIKDMRLSAYAGDEYYAPGYFNQFKNILLPCSFLAVSYYIVDSRLVGWVKRLFMFVVSVPVLFGVLGTGQRAFFVYFVLVSLIFVSLSSLGKVRLKVRSVFVFGGAFLIIFSASSYFLGRSESFTLVDSLTALFVRVFNDNQESAVYGFRLVYSLPIQYGQEWITDLLGILPGEYKGSNLPNLVHEIIYGSDRGTAPVSLWGSVYHNFGWFGIIFFPFLVSYIYCRLSVWFLGFREITPFRVSAFSYFFFVLGSWVASGPMQLVNNGAVTALLLMLVIKVWRRLMLGRFFSIK